MPTNHLTTWPVVSEAVTPHSIVLVGHLSIRQHRFLKRRRCLSNLRILQLFAVYAIGLYSLVDRTFCARSMCYKCPLLLGLQGCIRLPPYIKWRRYSIVRFPVQNGRSRGLFILAPQLSFSQSVVLLPSPTREAPATVVASLHGKVCLFIGAHSRHFAINPGRDRHVLRFEENP